MLDQDTSVIHYRENWGEDAAVRAEGGAGAADAATYLNNGDWALVCNRSARKVAMSTLAEPPNPHTKPNASRREELGTQDCVVLTQVTTPEGVSSQAGCGPGLVAGVVVCRPVASNAVAALRHRNSLPPRMSAFEKTAI